MLYYMHGSPEMCCVTVALAIHAAMEILHQCLCRFTVIPDLFCVCE